MEDKIVPGEYYIEEIYQWSLRMPVGVWYSLDKIKMDRQKFINCIIYLISSGEDLLFKNDFSAVKKVLPWEEEQKGPELRLDVMGNDTRDRYKPRGDTLFSRAYNPSEMEKQRLLWAKKQPSKFSNKLL